MKDNQPIKKSQMNRIKYFARASNTILNITRKQDYPLEPNSIVPKKKKDTEAMKSLMNQFEHRAEM